MGFGQDFDYVKFIISIYRYLQSVTCFYISCPGYKFHTDPESCYLIFDYLQNNPLFINRQKLLILKILQISADKFLKKGAMASPVRAGHGSYTISLIQAAFFRHLQRLRA